MFKYSYDNLEYQLNFKNLNNDNNKENIEEEKKDEDYNINENGQISKKLFDIIEIEEKNLILASFSKYHY